MHHFGNEEPAQFLGGGSRQLALAGAGFSPHQERPFRRPCHQDRVRALLVEDVPGLGPGTAGWKFERNVDADGGALGHDLP